MKTQYDNRVFECTAVNKNTFCKSRKRDAKVVKVPYMALYADMTVGLPDYRFQPSYIHVTIYVQYRHCLKPVCNRQSNKRTTYDHDDQGTFSHSGIILPV